MVTALPVRSSTSPTRDSSRTSTIGSPSIALNHQPPRKSSTAPYSATSTMTPPTIWVWHPGQTSPSTCSTFTMWPTPTQPKRCNVNIAKSGLPNTFWCLCTQSSFIAPMPIPTCFAGDASKQPMAEITWSTLAHGWTQPRNPRMPTWPRSLTSRWYPIDLGLSNPWTKTLTLTLSPLSGFQQSTTKPKHTMRQPSAISGTTNRTVGAVLPWLASIPTNSILQMPTNSKTLRVAFGRTDLARTVTTTSSTVSPRPTPRPSDKSNSNFQIFQPKKPGSEYSRPWSSYPNMPRRASFIWKRTNAMISYAPLSNGRPPASIPASGASTPTFTISSILTRMTCSWSSFGQSSCHLSIITSFVAIPIARKWSCHTTGPPTLSQANVPRVITSAQLASPTIVPGPCKIIEATHSYVRNSAWSWRPSANHRTWPASQPKAWFTPIAQTFTTICIWWNGLRTPPMTSSRPSSCRPLISFKPTTRPKTKLLSCTTRSRPNYEMPNLFPIWRGHSGTKTTSQSLRLATSRQDGDLRHPFVAIHLLPKALPTGDKRPFYDWCAYEYEEGVTHVLKPEQVTKLMALTCCRLLVSTFANENLLGSKQTTKRQRSGWTIVEHITYRPEWPRLNPRWRCQRHRTSTCPFEFISFAFERCWACPDPRWRGQFPDITTRWQNRGWIQVMTPLPMPLFFSPWPIQQSSSINFLFLSQFRFTFGLLIITQFFCLKFCQVHPSDLFIPGKLCFTLMLATMTLGAATPRWSHPNSDSEILHYVSLSHNCTTTLPLTCISN